MCVELSYDEILSQYTLYEHRIRGLSTAIWLTKTQPLPLGVPPKEPPNLRAYRAIATLLTTNPNEEGTITATGAPVTGAPPGVTIVAPFPDPTSRGKEKPSILVERISIHPDLRSVQDLSEHRRSESIDIVKHSTEVFQSLYHMLQTNFSSSESLTGIPDSESKSLKISVFILNRCWKGVKVRLDAAQGLLDFKGSLTLARVLKGWSPRPEDAVAFYEQWESVRDSNLIQLLQQERVPTQHFIYGNRAHFGFETASGWMKALGKTIQDLQEAVDRHASKNSSSSDLNIMAINLRTMAHLLNSKPIQQIFESWSFQTQLYTLRKRRSHSVEPNRFALDTIEDERKIGETTGHHVLRYLNSLVKWYKAVTADLPQLMARFENSPVIHVVKVPIFPQGRLKMHSPIFVARERLNQFLAAESIERSYTESETRSFYAALDGLFPRRPVATYPPLPKSTGPPLEEFFGSVHSLAIALSVVGGDSSSSSPHCTSPNWMIRAHHSRMIIPSTHSNRVPPEDRVLPPDWGFSTSSKRCCYCCSLLDEILASSRRGFSRFDCFSDLTVPLKNYYGAFVPWTPPPLGYGLSLRTLISLERQLSAILLGGILQKLDHVFSATNEYR
ncbi:hypothetical protein GGU11DRAFT_742434 [Lentinula aff. detonsa]|nr:hypothetical protein GGU11DRAFT_742434 [Lentinula aff. detonsa]